MPIPFMGCMLENQLLRDISKEKNGEIKALKDRIAELEKENAKLLDSVETVQSNRCVYKCVLTKEQLKQFAERVKMEFYYEFDEIMPSIMSDKIDKLLKEYLND